MKKSYFEVLIFLLVSMFSFQLYANTSLEIIIHTEKRILEAPQAEHYQWYLNGELLKANRNQLIEVKKTGRYSVVFKDKHGKENTLNLSVALSGNKIVRIYLVGDSTMQNYSIRSDYLTNYFPMAGWGEMFQAFMSSDSLSKISNIIEADSVVVINKAMGGRSTRVFWEEGRWKEVQDLLQAGDYVFIQFGHNDAASCTDYPDRCTSIPDFKAYLRRFVDSTRAMGAIPLLITPVNRDYPWSSGTISNVHGGYPAAMKEVASEKVVPLIDATQRSLDLFNEKGEDYTTKHYFMVFDAGTYPDYKVTTENSGGSPSNDRTHFQREGAFEISRLVFDGLQDLVQLKTEKEIDSSGIVAGAGWYEKKYSPTALVSASPNMGWKFANWTGDIYSAENPTEVLLDSHKTIQANFNKTDKVQYVIDSQVEGEGNLIISPFGGLYEQGSPVSIHVIPDKNWKFYSWIGDAKSSDSILNFTIEQNTSITALLVEQDATIFQAEEADFSQASIDEIGSYFTGTGFVGSEKDQELSISWDVYPEKSKYYGIVLRYNFDSEVESEAELIINDESSSQLIKFGSTGAKDMWKYSARKISNLSSGKNSIKIIAQNLPGKLYIDFLKVLGSGEFLDGPNTIGSSNQAYAFDIRIYPNPSNSQICLIFTLADESLLSISLYNMAGKRVYHQAKTTYAQGNHEFFISEKGLDSGIYALQMVVNDKILSEKLIIV